jgi:Glycosyl hydrolase family 99
MRRLFTMALAVSVLVASALGAAGVARAETPSPGESPGATAGPGASAPAAPAIPLFAFYYIWFDPSSWDRAKIDYPQLGHYSSDDPRVMRQHIEWAKSAGITGFIVSWKDTALNDRRLQVLMDVARQEDFKLAMIYQGLDFSRNPLPVSQVAADFLTFRNEFASDPVFFRLGGKPLTIWSGTWAFSHNDVAKVTGPVRDSMLVLNTQKNVKDYQQLADVTDGDAYYWSSVNPDTNTGHSTKLTAMSQAVHQNGKYWIAPFAPGFDARLVGGTSVVDRDNGQTLRDEYAVAVASSPDALGLISWNEFSENTYIEPSIKFGDTYLKALRDLRQVPEIEPTSAADSSDSETGGGARSNYWPAALIIAFPLALAIFVGYLGVRRRRPQAGPAGQSVGQRREVVGRHR